ncbi:bisanhydrobacterioruberin hydratase [Natrarchaeobaculum aegyptiacum]|uniref:Carotene biosynthesis protein n=1 Tax=Natrarchaeobaculum aegyptiacum TaxID=745377 RepID=A0A2Z2HZU2_9EURY|nr:bisanhydrobacterioruberin hydratase [Natrarchaeobaculum aegyptiacum]ARS91567.1 carotene biosynthesis protein [Natrarchaeobaculum aegyptiacum]
MTPRPRNRIDRRRLEARLDRLIFDNRITIAITFPLVGVLLLVSGQVGLLPEWLAFNPYLMVAAVTVMALPLIGGLVPLVDRRVAAGLVVLVVFTWAIELTGVHTGYPYGEFQYERPLGPMLLDSIPLFLPVFYFPILLNSYLLATLFLGRRSSLWHQYLLTLTIVITMDLVLDPGAVALEFWGWTDGGSYYDVPVQNYVGWLLSGSAAVFVLTVSLDHDAVVDRLEECDYFLDDLISFGIFWGLVNAYFLNLVPFAIAVVLLATLFRVDWFDFAGLGTGGPGRHSREG